MEEIIRSGVLLHVFSQLKIHAIILVTRNQPWWEYLYPRNWKMLQNKTFSPKRASLPMHTGFLGFVTLLK